MTDRITNKRPGKQPWMPLFHSDLRTDEKVLRWDKTIHTDPGADPFKLNNTHRPYYARLIMDAEPGLRGWFEIRKVGVNTTGEST